MSKNDIFFKVLFALGLALLPLVIFANHFIQEKWAMGLFLGGVLLVKIWFELFKDKYNYEHAIISAISSVLTFAVLLILFAVNNYVSITLLVITLILIVLYNVLAVVFFKKQLPEFVLAVDFCYMLFECIAIACFVVIPYITLPALIGIITLILTTVASCGYKLYIILRAFIDKRRR